MRTIRGVIVVVLILLAHSHANAQNAGIRVNTEIQVIGFGTTRCGAWIGFRTMNSYTEWNAMISWLQGYITAYDRYFSRTGFTGEGLTGEVVAGWLDKYCADNPLELLFSATEQLIGEVDRQATE